MTEAQKLAKAVLMFFRGGDFGAEQKATWLALTGSDEATTKTLCDLARKVEAQEGGWQ